MARKSTGKRTRFEVFKRDGFACQYCGAQPPSVVLTVDHIHPVSLGGSNEIDNLITACEACNGGKSSLPLGDRAIRPDADLMFLETQQEIAELRRYQQAVAEREALMTDVVDIMAGLWCDISGLDWHPTPQVIRAMIERCGVNVADAAIKDVAWKIHTGYLKTTGNSWLKYLHAVARNLAEQDGEE